MKDRYVYDIEDVYVNITERHIKMLCHGDETRIYNSRIETKTIIYLLQAVFAKVKKMIKIMGKK